ncbi:phospholipase [Bradyrhizobium liaoningense]
MPIRPVKDISKTDFAYQLRVHSLAFLPNINRFIDLKHPKAGRHILPVMDETGRHMRREASIESCLAARAAYEAELAEKARAEQQKADLADRLAPSALPPCRADLDGPAAVNQLADDFIVQTTRNDGVVFADLIRMGWQAEQLKQHTPAARIVAQRRQEKQMAELGA